MDLNQLNCFIAVAQRLSFTEAAKSLRVSQSAVSHNVAELEKELDTKLFVRSRSTVALTAPGEVLLKEAFEIQSIIGSVKNKIQVMGTGRMGELKIGYTFVPGIAELLGKFKQFHLDYPYVRVIYNTYDPFSLARMLEGNELDLSFGRLAVVSRQDEVEWRQLYTEQLHIAVARDHPFAGMKSVTLTQVAQDELILMNRGANPGLFDMVQSIFLAKGVTPRYNDTSNDIYTSLMMAEIGLGCTILPGRFKYSLNADVSFVPISDKEAYHAIGILWHKTNMNPSRALFLKALGVEE